MIVKTLRRFVSAVIVTAPGFKCWSWAGQSGAVEWSGFKLECSFCPQVAARPVKSYNFDIDVHLYINVKNIQRRSLPATSPFVDSVY